MSSLRLACFLAAAPLILVGGNVGAQEPASAAPAGAAAPEAATPAPADATAAPAPPPTVAAPPAPTAVDPETPKVAPRRAYVPAPADEHDSGLLVIPFLGLHSFQNDGATGLDAGLRLGVLVGGRVSDVLSLGGEAALDVLNPNSVPSGIDVTAVLFHLAFSPLLHARSGNAELVVGPKLGLFAGSEEASGGGLTASSTIHGWLYGMNLGAFGAVNDKVSMGGLLSFDVENATEECETAPGQAEMCSSSGLGSAAKVLGMTLALLF